MRQSGNAWPQVTNADIFKLNYGDLIDVSTYISRPQANYDILAVYSCKMPQDVKIRTKIKGKGRERRERVREECHRNLGICGISHLLWRSRESELVTLPHGSYSFMKCFLMRPLWVRISLWLWPWKTACISKPCLSPLARTIAGFEECWCILVWKRTWFSQLCWASVQQNPHHTRPVHPGSVLHSGWPNFGKQAQTTQTNQPCWESLHIIILKPTQFYLAAHWSDYTKLSQEQSIA